MFLVWNFSPEEGQVAIPWRKQMLKFNFMDGMFNIQLHNSFTKKKKNSHMFILCLKGLYSSSMLANKGKVAYRTPQQGEKNIKVDCYEIKTLCLGFFGGGRELCVWLPLSPLVSAREIKNSKRKTRRNFFFKSWHSQPPPRTLLWWWCR